MAITAATYRYGSSLSPKERSAALHKAGIVVRPVTKGQKHPLNLSATLMTIDQYAKLAEADLALCARTRRWVSRYEPTPGNCPMVGLSHEKQACLAERLGARLITGVEWEAAAAETRLSPEQVSERSAGQLSALTSVSPPGATTTSEGILINQGIVREATATRVESDANQIGGWLTLGNSYNHLLDGSFGFFLHESTWPGEGNDAVGFRLVWDPIRLPKMVATASGQRSKDPVNVGLYRQVMAGYEFTGMGVDGIGKALEDPTGDHRTMFHVSHNDAAEFTARLRVLTGNEKIKARMETTDDPANETVQRERNDYDERDLSNPEVRYGDMMLRIFLTA
ncbi:MAG: hypothetical protein JW873_03165 [Candidatus Saganbacteria bacterium]|nr:hypothetical protein [Candidatus Saganbacteria bacterium]